MQTTNVEQLLLDLLAIPSVSGDEPAVVAFIANRLAGRFHVERIPVDETRANLLCTVGSPRVILAAHVDTVPGEVAIRTDAEYIYGRGACDNKGAAAAMITAALEAADEGAMDFGLLFTVGEEIATFDGAVAAQRHFAQTGILPDRIVIGEPTDLAVVTAQRGIYAIRVSCRGTAEHSSTDAPDSAIHKLVALIGAFLQNQFEETTYHVGLIEGGTADNVVAGSASATLLFRSMDLDIANKITTALAVPHIPYDIEVLQSVAPVDHTAPPYERNTIAGFTEMALLPNSFVLGPGSIKDAHTDAERVPRAELNEVVALYRAFLPKKKSGSD